MPAVSAVVVAAGASQRFQQSLSNRAFQSKALFPFQGRPLLLRALEQVVQGSLHELCVVCSKEILSEVEIILKDFDFPPSRLHLIEGGPRRQDSVRLGLETLQECQNVLVHDGARPVFRAPFLRQLLEALDSSPAVVPALPSVETVVEVVSNEIQKPLDRSRVYRIQTPQAFDFAKLLELHLKLSKSEQEFTDDASLFRHEGLPVRLIEGDPLNLKITRIEDLKMLEAWLACGEI